MFIVLRVICETLEGEGRLTEAVECFQQIESELREDTGTRDERVQWEHGEWLHHDAVRSQFQDPRSDFREHFVEKLEKMGDASRDAKKHDEAIGYYSNVLTLDPTNLDILLKRSNEVWLLFHVT